MPEVSFLISNNRHHPAMLIPVIRHLTERRNASCRVLSLCELRGQPSPTRAFDRLGIDCKRVVPINTRRGPVTRGVSASKQNSVGHSKLQALLWRLFLGPRIAGLLSPEPDLVVVPNDAAYPYDRFVRMLRSRGVPYLLVQEGIRFELPGVPRTGAYGNGGAAAIAAWGESSAAYFREIGVAAGRIRLTGSPRFDVISSRRKAAEKPGSRNARTGRKLLLVTNPIDAQGLCSTREKLDLVRRFVDEAAPLLESREIQLTLKFHAGEPASEYERTLHDSNVRDLVVLAGDAPLYDLLREADAAVVMASTVGLEALLFGLRVGVLEVPPIGFAFDYVKRQAAKGLSWSAPMAPQIRDLLNYDAPGAADYLRAHLAATSHATEAVSELVVELAGKARA